MKRLFYLVLVVSSMMCFVNAQTLNPFSFYPYHAGDIRQYHSIFTGDLIYTIYTDSVVYRSTKDVFIYNRVVSTTTGPSIYRIDSMGNVYNMNYQPNYIRYKLYADSGDSWQEGTMDSVRPIMATVTYTDSVNIFGKTVAEKAFRIWWYQNDTSQVFSLGIDYLAEGFGLIGEQVEPSDQYALTGAIIDGVHYGTITSVNRQSVTIPNQIVLFQNYPNPFNPSTLIKYQIPMTGFITLKVYDLLGRCVENNICRHANCRNTYRKVYSK